jgi:hypothetical protein
VRVEIVLEDTTKGVYPVIRWAGNGVCDNYALSLSMNLAAQFAYTLKEYGRVGALKVLEKSVMD